MLVAGPAAANTAPRRVVSLNACLDAVLVHVADRGQIVALSHYAREPVGSTISEVAKTLPFTWETAEEVIALRPDLVLTSRHSALATRNALGRLNIQTELFSVPDSVAASLVQVREVARLVGRPARGQALIARIEAAIAAAAPPPGSSPLTALIYQPNGFAAGRGTLMDEMMTRAGFQNVAARYGLGKWGNVPVERLLADPPQVLLSGVPVRGSRTWADRVMRHPGAEVPVRSDGAGATGREAALLRRAGADPDRRRPGARAPYGAGGSDMTLPRPLVMIGLLLLIVALSVASMSAGRVWIPWSDWASQRGDPAWAILFELRLPRTVLALMVGAVLGLTGAALQGYTRNPLADPAILGVSTMAALGAVLTFYLGAAASAPWVLPVAAMIGAGVGVLLLLALAGATSSVVTFILAGVVIQTMAGAGVALALNLAPNPWAVNEIVNWLMGSLADRSVVELRLAAPGMILGCLLLLTQGRTLDALTLGEAGARSLGVRLDVGRMMLALGAALAVGSAVAVTGSIGFVGLIVPHLLRPLIGARPSGLLLPSALGGAALTLAADILVRLTPASTEIKLGVAMAALGGPFFLALLISMRRKLA
ncbi:iron chelate uptake ABC transporter family permease subunit [Brevundimonas vancanneytii]|uniref:Iron(III) dicitrate transport system permease protein fecD n=5 Tax=Brevundimonas TaxID=41275 RepID=A0A4P1JXY4_9CAUL|nr:iron chelate uptake ABC transporter family permease subunit [Brevundimonas vancanneytii]VTO12203.1 Iron(III) dicitrate transport system permease protein fecD [Brevundimonas vancanneytii]